MYGVFVCAGLQVRSRTGGYNASKATYDKRGHKVQLTGPSGTDDLTDDAWQGDQEELEPDPLETARTHVRALLHHTRILSGEPGDVLDLALRAAQRAFDEIGACNTQLDTASERGKALAREIEDRLSEQDPAAVPALLHELGCLAAKVAASEAGRQVVLRILGTAEEPGTEDQQTPPDSRDRVPKLTTADLPRVPSLYDSEHPGYSTLADMMAAQEKATAQRVDAHDRRSAVVTAHMVELVLRMADVSFSDPALNEEALAEVRSAYALWLECADERRRDDS
ncbi:hypothetical protein ABZ580_15355 [Streptomyces sp. NPDC012486]|uniref:hypothetical protein n=1 Tax=Streptomyces TaxID=1883 RepID=UPI00340B5AC3